MGELVAAGAQGGRALTEQQARLVEFLIADVPKNEADDPNVPKKEAWERAGYSKKSNFDAALASPAVQAALMRHRLARIGGGMAEAALRCINELITNEKTPSATRFAASRWVLEQAGHKDRPDDGQDKPLHEMTETELAAFMAKAQAIVDNGGEAPKIDIVPDIGAQRLDRTVLTKG